MAFSTTTPTYPTSFPVFAGTPRNGSCQLANADSTTAKVFSNFTPASTGTRVNEIRCQSGPTTAPGGTYIVQIMVNDGTNDRILDVFTLVNTVNTQQAILRYDNLILPSGYGLKAVVRTALTAGSTLDFIVMGSDAQVS
jgi:hypothetical protein